ncbi:MAG: polyphosphate kinase 2 family protein [Verrucomicrobiota bacterium]|nr:polyphosphate kinase 2 family protein [Verrucomicrobiota bacterium]
MAKFIDKFAVIADGTRRITLRDIDTRADGSLAKDEGIARTIELQQKMLLLQSAFFAEHARSLLVIFQAMDTGGKDGAVKWLCGGLDPAGVRITSFKIPTHIELDHDFLWRVHKCVPPRGMVGIWNRSHYEDVLVARVHSLVKKDVWKSHYDDINAFEKIITRNGVTVVKFFLHISKDEQKARLEARLKEPDKLWKFNPDDLKDREQWDDFQCAYEDSINRCATPEAPWYIIPADRKWARNLAVVETISNVFKKLDPRYPKPTFDPAAIVVK